jgi:Domain of unknown function (DUF4389)
MTSYAATFDITPPQKFDRVHIAIRVLIAIVLAIPAGLIGWLYGAVYLAVPVVAAILISQRGAERYLAEANENMTKWLRYLLSFYAYMGLLTDRLPNEEPKETLHFEVATNGSPTAGSTLLRIILAIPSAIVLGLLGIVAGILVLFAAIMILIQETYPEGVYNYLRGVLRWEARLLAYVASLVDEYPPFALDMQSEGAAPAPPSAG